MFAPQQSEVRYFIMKCSKCGEEINENQGFCLKCGNPIQLEPDFNSIESELASNVSELLDETEDTPKDELPEEESMVTVDVPYDEINMEIKMVDITKPQVEKVKKVEIPKNDAPKEEIKNADPKKNGKKKAVIAAIIIAVVALIAAVIVSIWFISENNSKKTYEGNYERAVSAKEKENYDDALEYAKSAVKLATSNVEEIKARKLLNSIYETTNNFNDDYADNLYELILLGETSKENFVTLVKYYYEHQIYEKINQVTIKITEDDIFDAWTDYIPKPPVAEQESGQYAGYVVVKLSADNGNKIFYTLNEEDNLNAGIEYADGIKILGEEAAVLTCYAVDEHGIESRRVEYKYVIEDGKMDGPKVTPTSGSYEEAQKITVEVPEGSKAYYTTDGTDPDSSSTEYTEPIIMPRGTSKFKFIVYDSFGLPSAITTESYNLKVPRAISVNEAITLVENKLIEDGAMDTEHKTVYGTLAVSYDKTVVIGMDEYYVILATESDNSNNVITITIYGVNTYDSSITDKIIDANGEYTIEESEKKTTSSSDEN